jgi:hypothetical protein
MDGTECAKVGVVHNTERLNLLHKVEEGVDRADVTFVRTTYEVEFIDYISSIWRPENWVNSNKVDGKHQCSFFENRYIGGND